MVVALAAAACTGSVAPEQFASALADAQCGALSRCVPQASYLDDQCRTQVVAQLRVDVAAAVAAGRIRYDGAKARECIDAFASARCVPSGVAAVDSSACFAALQGTLAGGAECGSQLECASAQCLPDASGACPAHCAVALGAGEPCNAHSAPFCDFRQNLTCVQGTCRAISGEGGPCSLNAECAPGFVCAGGACASLRRAFAGCASDESCAPGLFCAGGGDEESGECLPRAGAGSACARTDGLTDAALRGAECGRGLACVGAGRTTAGDFVPGACADVSFAGGPCRDEDADMQVQITGCADGLICAGGTCVDPPESGPCAPHDACKPGVAFCSGGACVPQKALGEPCSITPECGPGNSCAGVCVAGQPLCQPP